MCFCFSVYSRVTSKLPGNSSVSDYHLAVSMPGYRYEPHLAFDVLWGSSSDPQGLHNKSFFLQSHFTTGSFALGTIALLTRGNWNTKVVLSCISMVANGVEFFLQCLLAICVSSFEARVFTFITHFLIVLFIFLMYSFSMSLDIDLLWDICGRQPTLPQFCRLPLNLKCSCICCKEAF